MAFTSGFFDAELIGGAYDRVYSAEAFAEYFSTFIANGVFPTPATNLQVSANAVNDMNVLVGAGMGWINGYWCKNSGPYPIAIQAASGTLNRIDIIVFGWNKTTRTISSYVKTGTASASPTAPDLVRNADLYELMLASVTVTAGATKITQANITDKRADKAVCGWVSGVVDQIDATNLFAQYDAAFKTWFKDIQDQLSGDVATNLQNQINTLKTDVKNQGSDITPIKAGSKNILDLGNIFLMSEQYAKEVFDAIPCTGGVYSTASLPQLFSMIGYSFGAHLATKALSQLKASSKGGCIDPITGKIYICENNSIHIYSSAGVLVKSLVLPGTSGGNVGRIKAYGGVVAATQYSDGDKPFISLDGGDTWDSYTRQGNAASVRGLGICGNFVLFSVASYGSPTREIRYDLVKKVWSKLESGGLDWYTVGGVNSPSFGSSGNSLKKLAVDGTWSYCDIGTKGDSGVVIDNSLYTLNSSGKVIRVDQSGKLVQTYEGYSLSYVTAAAKLGEDIIILDSGSSTDSKKTYIAKPGEANLASLTLTPLPNTALYFIDCAVFGSNLTILFSDTTRQTSDAVPTFQAPTISIPGATAYLRTKSYSGV